VYECDAVFGDEGCEGFLCGRLTDRKAEETQQKAGERFHGGGNVSGKEHARLYQKNSRAATVRLCKSAQQRNRQSVDTFVDWVTMAVYRNENHILTCAKCGKWGCGFSEAYRLPRLFCYCE